MVSWHGITEYKDFPSFVKKSKIKDPTWIKIQAEM